jgi:hypothetical protein
MAPGISPVIDAKTTCIMSYKSPVLSSCAHPVRLFTCLHTENFLLESTQASMNIGEVWYFLTKIIVISNWSDWISAQGVHVCMLQPWSMHDLEAKVLQHANPSSSPAMRIRNSGQPL